MIGRDWAVAGLLATAVLAAHGGALGGSFHYDDAFAIVNNPAVRSWEPARAFFRADAVISEQQRVGYRPLTVTSFGLTYRFAGLDPLPYLATNLTFHALAAFLVFLICRELMDDVRWAALAGLTFALHPVNAEAVNYVVARSSIQSTFFALAATWAFVRCAVGAGSAQAWILGLVAFVGALLTKESAVALVIPLLAFLWLRPRGQASSGRGANHARLVTTTYIAAAVLFVAFWHVMTAGGVEAPVPSSRPAWTYLELVGRSLALWIWPWPLGLDHPLTFLTGFDVGLAVALVAGLGGLAFAVLLLARRVPLAAWGLVWALAGLAPLAPLPWLTTVALLQEHRIGFSAAGLSWMTAALVRVAWEAAGRWRFERVVRVALACVGAVLGVVAVGVDRSRSAVWQDDRRLWTEAVQRSPDNLLARLNLGQAYVERGEDDRAEAEYRAIIALAPAYPRVYYNLGLLALRRARPDEAIAAFGRTVALDPRNAAAHAHLGILAMRAGDGSAAEAAFEAARRIDPTRREVLSNLAAIYLERREWSKALDLSTQALQRDPGFLDAAYNRGVALAGLGRRAEADAELRDVRDRLPTDAAFDQYRSGIDYLLAGGTP